MVASEDLTPLARLERVLGAQAAMADLVTVSARLADVAALRRFLQAREIDLTVRRAELAAQPGGPAAVGPKRRVHNHGRQGRGAPGHRLAGPRHGLALALGERLALALRFGQRHAAQQRKRLALRLGQRQRLGQPHGQRLPRAGQRLPRRNGLALRVRKPRARALAVARGRRLRKRAGNAGQRQRQRLRHGLRPRLALALGQRLAAR
jgi:hypothetical protein